MSSTCDVYRMHPRSSSLPTNYRGVESKSSLTCFLEITDLLTVGNEVQKLNSVEKVMHLSLAVSSFSPVVLGVDPTGYFGEFQGRRVS